jgi:ribosomal protein L22
MSPSKPSTPSEGKPEDVAKVAQDAADTKTAPVEDEATAAVDSERERSEAKPKARARRKKAAPAAEGTAADPATERERSEAEPVAEAAAKPKRRAAKKAPAAEAEASTADDDATTAEADAATAEAEPETATEDAPKPRRTRRKAEPEKPAAPAAKPRRAVRDYGDTPPMVRAHAKYVRTSARKARLVCDHIRGKSVEEARAILAHANRDVARDWSKLLESAVANAEHNHELIGDELRIAAVKADEGPTLKRFRPRAMGRATKIRKRTSHLSITLTPKDGDR